MDWVELLKAIAAVLGGAAAAATALTRLPWLSALLRPAQASAAVEAQAMRSVYETLYDALRHSNAHRIVVLRAEGEDLERFKGRTVSTLIFEAAEDPIPPVGGRWEDVEIDDEYSAMLCEVADRGEHLFGTSSLPEGGRLRDIYEGDGVLCGYVIEIGRTERTFYYAAANFSDREPDASDRGRLRADLRRIGKLILRHRTTLDPGAGG